MTMKHFAILIFSICVICSPLRAETEPFNGHFNEEFAGKLQDGWSWIREVPENYRFTKDALEIKMEPNPGEGIRNILVRKAPKESEGSFTVQLDVDCDKAFSNQYQQVGIYWLNGENLKFKFVKEFIDGKLYVFPGKKPLQTQRVTLRLHVDGKKITCSFKPHGATEFEKVHEETLPERDDENDRISIQCWHGPVEEPCWTRLNRFQIFSQIFRSTPPLRVVYFTPSDRDAPENRHERLGRVLKHVQNFYRKQMQSHGYGPMSFALEWTEPERLKIYDVKGRNKRHEYPEGTEWRIREEVRETLAKEHGVNIDQEYVLILGPFIDWKDDLVVEYGPRVSGLGSIAAGCAWAYDDARVDPDFLTSLEPGGFTSKLGSLSLGKHNTFYIGTIAHELGHCFGFPHDRELDSQRKIQGVSLMGVGNYHYAEEVRGEGPGTFLSEAAALFFSTTRAFNPDFSTFSGEGHLRLTHFDAVYENGKIILNGHLDATPAVTGVIAFNDNLNIKDDYDATSWVAKPDENGNFRVEIKELEKAPCQLRLKLLLPNGFLNIIEANYSNVSGVPDLEPINTLFEVAKMNQFLDEKKFDDVEKILKSLYEKYPNNHKWARKLRHLETVKSPPEPFEPGKIDENEKRMDLSYAKTVKENVGWYEPSWGILRDLGFMEVCGAFFESGLFAHANSCYEFSLDGKWKELEFSYGIQGRHPGSVVFVVRGDGRELFRSKVVKSGELLFGQVGVTGVDKLELMTEESENRNHNDWSLWLRPTLLR